MKIYQRKFVRNLQQAISQENWGMKFLELNYEQGLSRCII